ncbi:dihydroorotase family protein [Campylobacter sp. 2018MI13]|uniref:dihydroorotase n=1 Tax=Campylobacter sp. 2018MI13 TaxID=2836737 RepID=UPI001BD97DE4|nr:dihydroorotase family protein [Campylobacter sp. 2018MI13]MBT0882367.1 dihydroorotase family protein [Campylobacter sp. 2018MI13]
MKTYVSKLVLKDTIGIGVLVVKEELFSRVELFLEKDYQKSIKELANIYGFSEDAIDLRDKIIFPSAIDSQVHSRSQANNEDFELASKQASAGGVSVMVEMPYDAGLLISNANNFNKKLKDGLENSYVDFALYATINPEDGIKNIEELIKLGACGFKLSLFGTDPVRFPRIPPYLMYEVMLECAKYDVMVGVHNEDHESVIYLTEKIKQERTDYKAHNLSRPEWVENIAVNTIYELGASARAKAHVVHASNKRALEIANNYKKDGYKASVECCLHYLICSEEDEVRRLNGIAKINPPIRDLANKEAIWECLKNGLVDVVSTDHVRWSKDRKSNENIFLNSSGAAGLEVLLPLFLSECKKRNVDLSLASKLLSTNPAKLFKLPNKGELKAGNDADFVILSEDTYKYYAKDGFSNLDYSLYEGYEMLYKINEHYVRGNKVFDGKNVYKLNAKFINPNEN